MVIKKARRVVLLLDVSKLDKILPYTVCGLDMIDIIITDSDLPSIITQEAKKNGTQIILA